MKLPRWTLPTLLASLLAVPAIGAPMLEARVAAEPAPSKAKTYAVPGGGGRIALTQAVLFTEVDVESVWVEPEPGSPGRFLVAVRLEPGASARLRTFSAGAIGARVGLLLDGKLTAAPVIRDAVDGARLPVAFELERADADRTAGRLNGAKPGRR